MLMAFSPFTWFRKHQKVFFAGLTIVCMITFVASFGAGDVIQTGLSWVGARGRAGPYVTTLNGNKVYERDLVKLARQRKLAHEFIRSVVLPERFFRLSTDLEK